MHQTSRPRPELLVGEAFPVADCVAGRGWHLHGSAILEHPPDSGGKSDPACGETAATFSSTTVSGEDNFSAYNEPVSITAPKGAITPGPAPQQPTS
jgi:hypothetical protein